MSEIPIPKKKGRGRPRGSKNKPNTILVPETIEEQLDAAIRDAYEHAQKKEGIERRMWYKTFADLMRAKRMGKLELTTTEQINDQVKKTIEAIRVVR